MKITVVTATWNSGATVADTLESVLAQSWGDVEHVVVDGGSDDNTVDIVMGYEERYRKAGKVLKCMSERDKGLYDAMNKGIGMATGDVIGILNSDDFYTRGDVLERVAEVLTEAEDVDAVYGDVHFVNPCDLDREVRYYSSKGFRRWMMRLGFMPAHPSFYCRKGVYERFGLFMLDMKGAADFEFLLRTIFVGRIRTRYMEMDFVTMRTGGASTSGLHSHRRAMGDHLKAYKHNGVWSCTALELMRYIWKGTALIVYRFRQIV